MFTPSYHRHKLSFAKGSPDHDDQPHLCVCVCVYFVPGADSAWSGNKAQDQIWLLSIWQAGKSTRDWTIKIHLEKVWNEVWTENTDFKNFINHLLPKYTGLFGKDKILK